MKTVKITMDNKISIIDIPFTLDGFYKAIGCECMETVKTKRMFELFQEPVLMLVDESGLLKGLDINRAASVLYGFAQHGQPIVGNVIFGQIRGEDIVPPKNVEKVKSILMDHFWFLEEESGCANTVEE
mgnify:CR=1 FL=1